eukprot:scaffold94980_cov13-Tisochrysis_lutea.AAC.1
MAPSTRKEGHKRARSPSSLSSGGRGRRLRGCQSGRDPDPLTLLSLLEGPGAAAAALAAGAGGAGSVRDSDH